MAFDVDKLMTFCILEIQCFAAAHKDETFYAFAIDASLLCLNSEEEFAATLKKYQDAWNFKTRPIETWQDLTNVDLQDSDFMLRQHEKYAGLDRRNPKACLAVINQMRSEDCKLGNPYLDAKGIKTLRENTGDWSYQGFADMENCDGFDRNAYLEHYNMSDEAQKTSLYGTTMDALVESLQVSNVFNCLKMTPTFYATRIEHHY